MVNSGLMPCDTGVVDGPGFTANDIGGGDMARILSTKLVDFEKWVDLANTDPEQFEAMRRAAINEFLDSVSGERRLQLQRLQWRVDRVRERSATPLAATIAISQMMWDAFYHLHDCYQDVFQGKSGMRYKRALQRQPAKILPFEAPATT